MCSCCPGGGQSQQEIRRKRHIAYAAQLNEQQNEQLPPGSINGGDIDVESPVVEIAEMAVKRLSTKETELFEAKGKHNSTVPSRELTA